MLGNNIGNRMQVVAQSAAAATHTGNTNETTLATITLPPMGVSDRVAVKASFGHTSSANNKTLRIKLGATTIFSTVQGANAATDILLEFGNRGSASSQWSSGFLVTAAGSAVLVVNTAAIDTSAGASLTITGQLALAGESVALEAHQVTVYRG